jgi:hypothetical protein
MDGHLSGGVLAAVLMTALMKRSAYAIIATWSGGTEMWKRMIPVLVILSLAIVLTGCQAGPAKTRKTLPEWSRGEQLGLAGLNQPIHIVAQDSELHLIWVTVGGKALHYARLDGSGQVQVSTDLHVGGAHASEPKLLLPANGSFGLLWTDNPNIPRALFYGKFSLDGQPIQEPTQLSPAGASVSSYAVVQNLDGSFDIFWADEIPSDGGVHYLRLAADGKPASTDRLLIRAAESPTAQVSADGLVHLAWVEEPSTLENDVYYAVFTPATGEIGDATYVASYHTGTGLIAHPPLLGLDEDTVYLFWALEHRAVGGLNPGQANTYFVSFPLDNPRPSEPVTLDIPGVARPSYVSASGSLPYRQLGDATAGPPSYVLYMPAPLNTQNKELGVFLVGEVATRNQTSTEVVWAIFESGQLKGYQLVSKVGSALRPRGVVDQHGNIHLTWLATGGFGRYEVYYASTSTAVMANLDRVTLQDRAMDFLNSVWSLAPALGVFPPVLLLWTFASFVWMVVFYFVRVEGGMERRASQVAFVVAILLYLLSKLFLMPAVLFYAPFLDRLPSNLQFIPVIGTPLFTLLVALGAVWFYYRKREYRSLLASYLIFVMTDALLSLIIYVPRWLAG